jgi:hypothetical protein
MRGFKEIAKLAVGGVLAERIVEWIDSHVPEEYIGKSEYLRGTRELIEYFDIITCKEKHTLKSYDDVIRDLRKGGVRKNMFWKTLFYVAIDAPGAIGIYFLTGLPLPLGPCFWFMAAHDILNIPIRGLTKILRKSFEESNYRSCTKALRWLEYYEERASDLLLALKNFLLNPGYLLKPLHLSKEPDMTEVEALKQELAKFRKKRHISYELSGSKKDLLKNLAKNFKGEFRQVYHTFKEHQKHWKRRDHILTNFKKRYDYVLSQLLRELERAKI